MSFSSSAHPATEWLQGCGVAVDKAGFVITGAHFGEGENRSSSPLETLDARSIRRGRRPVGIGQARGKRDR